MLDASLLGIEKQNVANSAMDEGVTSESSQYLKTPSGSKVAGVQVKHRSLDIRTTRAADGVTVQIELRRDAGPWRTYHTLADVPEEYRSAVERLLAESSRDWAKHRDDALRREGSNGAGTGDASLRLSFLWLHFGLACVWTVIGLFAFVWLRHLWNESQAFDLRMLLAGGCVVVAACLVIASLFNRTVFLVDGAGLTVQNGLLQWRRRRFFPRCDIEQLFVRVRMGGSSDRYALFALVRGREIELVSGFARVESLRRLELAIEWRLGLIDQAVLGAQFR